MCPGCAFSAISKAEWEALGLACIVLSQLLQGLKGSWGVAVVWHWGGHPGDTCTLAGDLCPPKHSWHAWICAQPLEVPFPFPGATCQAPRSGCHWLSAPLPEIHLQLFYFTVPNPQSEKGISCLYMELQTCIEPPKMFLSKNLDGCQLP